MDINQILEKTKRAIINSGKTIDKLPKNSIMQFLKNAGVDSESTRNEIYKMLTEPQGYKVLPSKVERKINKDLPNKSPRKSIFGEITRIA